MKEIKVSNMFHGNGLCQDYHHDYSGHFSKDVKMIVDQPMPVSATLSISGNNSPNAKKFIIDGDVEENVKITSGTKIDLIINGKMKKGSSILLCDEGNVIVDCVDSDVKIDTCSTIMVRLINKGASLNTESGYIIYETIKDYADVKVKLGFISVMNISDIGKKDSEIKCSELYICQDDRKEKFQSIVVASPMHSIAKAYNKLNTKLIQAFNNIENMCIPKFEMINSLCKEIDREFSSIDQRHTAPPQQVTASFRRDVDQAFRRPSTSGIVIHIPSIQNMFIPCSNTIVNLPSLPRTHVSRQTVANANQTQQTTASSCENRTGAPPAYGEEGASAAAANFELPPAYSEKPREDEQTITETIHNPSVSQSHMPSQRR